MTRQVKIKVVGVWDTVGTLGLPLQPWLQRIGFPTSIHKYRFYDTGISDDVENAFQALALDEQRAAFNATVWEKQEGNTTTLRQVWFPGAHSNIGGGYEETGAADLSLSWMVDQLSPFLSINEDYLLEDFERNRTARFTVSSSGISNGASNGASNGTSNGASTAATATEDAKPTKAKPLWQWGMSLIFNGLSFPTSIAGSLIRTPGRYPVLDYETGKPAGKGALLRDTQEAVHASTRVRTVLAGDGPSGQKPYNPVALKGWTLSFGKRKDGTEGALWTYKAKGDPADGRELPEAPLGRLEEIWLAKDAELKERLAKLYPKV
jgi:hypothetical protein